MYNKLIPVITCLCFTCVAQCQYEPLMQYSEKKYQVSNNLNKSHPNDTVHSPKKAAVFSAILPGLGQAYNRKYWKIPIIYTGLGTAGWFIYNNHKNYQLFKKEYLYRINNNLQIQNEDLSIYSEDQLRVLLNQYHRWRDFSIAAAVVVYTLNIIDALVDGYLWRFDADDQTLSFKPGITFDNTSAFYTSFNISYNFANSFHKKKYEHRFIRLR